MSMIKEFLTDNRYTFVEEFYDADIVFTYKHFKNFKYIFDRNFLILICQSL